MKTKHIMSKKVCMAMMASMMAVQPVSLLSVQASDTPVAQNGALDIAMDLSLPTKGQTFAVTLDGANQQTGEMHVNADGTEATYSFQDVAPATYTLTIKSEGYATYTQQITIMAGTTTRIALNNNHQINEGLDKKHGIMAVGDINQDGKIDDKDAEEMMQAIDAGKTDATYDLNNDNKVNVLDLTYITMNYGENVVATPLSTISEQNITVEQPDADKVTVKGELSDLTANTNTHVQFAPKNGEISEQNPIELSLEIKGEGTNAPKADGIVIKPPVATDNLIDAGSILVETATGEKIEATIISNNTNQLHRVARSGATATVESDGSVVVNLGEQIAIKKVTIKVTGASTNLVDIAQVEFVNGMENRVPAPELNIPTGLQVTETTAGMDPSFTVTWKAQPNVTGYEVMVSANGKQTVTATTNTSLKITDLRGKLHSYVPYTVRVRSTNGSWKSPYSDSVVATIKPTTAPPAPENVNAQGNVQSILVSWKDMQDTQSYSVFYREQNKGDYKEIPNIKANSYTINDLQPGVKYQVYVVGHNEIGNSPASGVQVATPYSATATKMPKYGLINTSNGTGNKTNHVVSVSTVPATQVVGGEFATVDDNPATYTRVEDWDTGYHYTNFANPMVTFDQEYKIQTIRFTKHDSQTIGFDMGDAAVRYFDKTKNAYVKMNGYLTQRKDSAGRPYYELNLPQPITSNQFQLCLVALQNARNITIADMNFYYFDELTQDINDLYADNLHLTLKNDVNIDTITALEERVNTVDSISGEYHPNREGLQKELENAKVLLNQQGLGETIAIDTTVTPNADKHLDFDFAISEYQPLGKTAKAGETVIVYVGSDKDKEGTKTPLTLITTQNHAEAGKWMASRPLQVGRNEITIPDITSQEFEKGGSLYIAYAGNANPNTQYSVRISGGEDIPMLNVSGKTGEDRKQAIADYVSKLEAHVAKLEAEHQTQHADSSYDAKSCILNYTDIVMDNMMYSVPATQVLKGLGEGNRAENLAQAISAMEQEMDLFYQHKGLHKTATDTNRYPKQRLNIRYHQMFAGAFMYAGGKHIGIEYDSVPGLFGIRPIETDENGKRLSGQLTGWGIAHEIGHVINSKPYAVAEITNNYYSILATNFPRSDYNKVYDMVTGGGGDAGLQMSMYWQLHMFYDKYDTYKTFDNTKDQMDNLFFARVDAYARNPQLAPQAKDGGIALTLTKSKSDNLIRLASASAQKNLLPFFEAWGLTYDAETARYAQQFPAETHKIQYMSPTAHAYKLANGTDMASGTTVSAKADYTEGENTVRLTLENTDKSDAMLGYEIIRNGKAVAFVTADQTSYVDTITTGNNRTYTYEVVAYDKLLNATKKQTLDAIKVKHNGAIDRKGWTITTNMTSTDDEVITPNDDNGYCETTRNSAITRIINGKGEVYRGTAPSTGKAEFVIDLGKTEQVTALEYDGATAGFTVSVSNDGERWETAKKGQFTDGKQTIYFDQADKENYMYIYDASFVKVTFDNAPDSISNVNILGPTSDNVELLTDGIGKLKNEFHYGKNPTDVIPKGSAVFTGTYKGNPAYNVVLLKDANGNIIEGSQIILAENPKDGQLGEVSEGTWVYWIEPEDLHKLKADRVKAELYRVDNAQTNENERLVSDTLYLNVPSTLPELELKGGEVPTEIMEMMELVPATPIEKDVIEALPLVPATPNEGETENNTEPNTDEQQPTTPDTDANTEQGTEQGTEQQEQPQTDEQQPEQPQQPDGEPNGEQAPEQNNDAQAPEAQEETQAEQSEQAQPEETEETPADAPETQAVSFKKQSRFSARNRALQIALRGNVMRQGSVTADKNNKPHFSFETNAENSKKATMSLHLGDAQTDKTIALQTAFTVSDANVTDVVMHWSESVSQRALLKACRYDKATKTVTIYVTATEDLLDSGVMTLGDISMKSKGGVQKATITLKPNSTVTVSDALVDTEIAELTGTAELQTENENRRPPHGGGSSNSNTSTDKTDKTDKNETNQEETQKPEEQKQETQSDVATVFGDVSKDAWYYNAVQRAYEKSWFKGTSATAFTPNGTMTRGMFVTVLGRFAGANGTPNTKFTDVSANKYYAGYVAWASEQGIVSGVSATKFAPEDSVTREQLAVMIYGYLRATGVELDTANAKQTFTDDKQISKWANEAVYAMQQSGLMSGMPNGSFQPKGTATRAEVATIMMQLENKLQK